MVLRDKHRAAEPNCPTMASDQPLKKKQRTQPPDPQCEGGGGGFCIERQDASRSEDSVDCAAIANRNSAENFQLFAGHSLNSAPSTSEVANGIHNPHYPFSVQTLDGFNAYNPSTDTRSKNDNSNGRVSYQSLDFLQEHLVKQCLCSVSDEYLRTPFSSRLNISEWPPDEILLFLSNLQLLFDVYLKQNYKGHICTKLMDVCNMLVRNEHDWLGEVVHLSDHHSKFVNFIACRVVSSFLILAKNNIDHEWLQIIMDNTYLFDTFNFITINKINFSLDIIKRVVEWKDIDQHPLEDSAYINTSNPVRSHDEPGGSGLGASSSSAADTPIYDNHLQNAFSNLHTTNATTSPQADDSNSNDPEPSGSSSHHHIPDDQIESNLISPVDNIILSSPARMTHFNHIEQDVTPERCRIITLTDSESFDTAHVKCLTIKCLERHWPKLVENVKQLLTRYINLSNSEDCILTFLTLWENIISVKANLSVVDTKPFYMDFQSFVELLRYTHLPSLIYTQLLSLFNEVLCYGSTLALQDVLPEETCTLAHSIVRFVKDFRLLNGIRLRHNQTGFNFIGFDSPVFVSYNLDQTSDSAQSTSIALNESYDSTQSASPLVRSSACETDKTMLQKMVLLVLKSVAVTVKEMRCDSSDSSIDSTDYNAIQDMQMVERSIRDVLKKLDVFLKTTLNFLPDSPFTKILIHLFSDQDDYLIESMVCTLDITVGIVYRNSVFPDLIPMLNPIASFIEFLEVVSYHSDILLDYLVSNETCFLLYLLRFLKYVRKNWSKFVASCRGVGSGTDGLDNTMAVLTRLRLQINRLVTLSLFPYNIGPVLKLLERCEDLYEGNELS
ncbi:protein lines homolog [Arctopsyche grandis]|uniref:protein lines homolog n=1 Tax=Arctopsyche grandis TaxID=121162 RepID=UPI00406D7511